MRFFPLPYEMSFSYSYGAGSGPGVEPPNRVVFAPLTAVTDRADDAAGHHRELACERVHGHSRYRLYQYSSTVQGACRSTTRRDA
jgi:hypothetical protein